MEYDFNTSLMVRDALPEVIQRAGLKDIRIWKYGRVTRDTYSDVRQVSQDIWGGRRDFFLPVPQPSEKEEVLDIDVILHFGMVAFGWPESFRFETVARRDGYEKPGDDGQYVDSAALKRLGLPKTLNTCFDIEAAWRGVKAKFPVSGDHAALCCTTGVWSLTAAIGRQYSGLRRCRPVLLRVPSLLFTCRAALNQLLAKEGWSGRISTPSPGTCPGGHCISTRDQ